MKLSILIKSIYSGAVFYSGMAERALHKKNDKGSFLILMYHRITYPEKTIQPGMYVTPGTFEKHLEFLRKKFTVVSLNDLHTLLKNKQSHASEKPVCVITFDDGWKDFYNHAFPLLRKYNLPATVFLPTGYIGTDERFWTDIFADLLLRKKNHSQRTDNCAKNQDILDKINSQNGGYEQRLEQGIAILKALPRVKISEILDELSILWCVDSVPEGRDFVNWSEVEAMRATKLISFGSHTVSHEILTTLADEKVRSELVNSKDVLLEKGLMDSTCQSFCYPNGGCNSKITELVHQCGYQIAVTTKDGWINYEDNLMALNRVGIHQDMTSTVPLFASRAAGFI